LLFQAKPHATIQTVVIEILLLKMVNAALAQFSKNQALSLPNVVPLVLSVLHLQDNALRKMVIVLLAQITQDVKEVASPTVVETDYRVNNNVAQISAN